jgi:hypothetical protein
LLHQINLKLIGGSQFRESPIFSFSSPFSSIFSLKPWKLQGKVVSLHKKSCTRQIESKLSLRSFAFSLPPNSLKKIVYVKLGLKIMNLCESVKSVGVFYVPRISQIYTDFLCPGLAASAFTFPQ